MSDAPASNTTRQDWIEVFALLDVALELDPAARAPWLAALDPTQARLSPLLQALLSTHAGVATDDFLQTPAAFVLEGGSGMAVPRDASADAAPQSIVGPYRLLREIGQGGMATVWLAERADGLLQRQVALKLPHLSWGNTSLAERMARERDILASLTHPHIARLYDAGVTAQGRPYLALEYVDGQPIDTYAAAHSLTVPQRLALVLQVAQAVAHAHARLVVHRDLKPSNILVDAQRQAHLLDFGIARLLDPASDDAAQGAGHTQALGRVLTPDYASPEQIRGEPIGTASDVYSLGVVSYELLAGTKPYELKRQGAAALEVAIAAVDLRPASAAAGSPEARRALKGDLDAILNKALKQDIAERYPTVEAFAQDIERHLANLPVRARPDAPGYRARKFLRRNQLAVLASAAVGVSLVAGLSMATWQARVAMAQADRAEQVKAFVLSIFADADNDSEAGTSRTGADLLKLARQRVGSETGGRPEVAVELMTAIGTSMIGQGLMADAEALMRDAVALASRQLGPAHALTSGAQLVYGEALVELGRNKEAVATLQSGIESARRSANQRQLVTGQRWLSTAQFNDGRIEEGLAAARQAVADLSSPHGTGQHLTPRDVMLAHQAYADALGQADRPGAVAAARLALAAAHAVYGDKVVPSVLDIRTMLALAQVIEGQIEEGLRDLDALVPATATLLGPAHPRVSKIAHLVGNARLSAGDVHGAIAAFRRSMEVEDAIAGSNSTFDRGMARFFLGSAYAAARQTNPALTLLAETATLLGSAVGPSHLRTLRAASAHASQLAEAGRLVESEAQFSQLASAAWPAPDLAGHRRRLAVLRSLQGRHAEAVSLAVLAHEALNRNPNKNVRARGLAVLGTVRLDAGDPSQALPELQQALALFAQTQPGMSPERADTLIALGRSQLQLGDTDAAVLALKAADDFWQSFDASNRHALAARLQLGRALQAQGGKPARSN